MHRAVVIIIALSCSASAAPPSDPVGQARGAALQADARRAVELVKGVDPATLPEKERLFVTCIRERFSRSTPEPLGGSGFADRALSIYRSYWHSSLMHPGDRELQGRQLEAALRRLLGAKPNVGMDLLETMLAKRIEKEGLHSLEGTTGLLRELMVWGKQDEKLTDVALPEGNHQVKVIYLNDFRSFGWSHYATCGRAATGGWATEEGLFAVVPRYESLDNEEFRVTFLGHEAQHFADKARFKGLKDWELEYRAKLVELALAESTRAKVLTRFVDDQGSDEASPHSYANRAVLNEMVKRLKVPATGDLFTVDLEALHAAARQALIDDSAGRTAGAVRKPT